MNHKYVGADSNMGTRFLMSSVPAAIFVYLVLHLTCFWHSTLQRIEINYLMCTL